MSEREREREREREPVKRVKIKHKHIFRPTRLGGDDTVEARLLVFM